MYAGRFIPHINIGNLSTKNRRKGVKSKHFFEDVLQSDVIGCMKSTTFFFGGGRPEICGIPKNGTFRNFIGPRHDTSY